MPNAMMLTDLFVPEGHGIRVSLDDLRNMYHVVPASWERAKSTPVGKPYCAKYFRGWSCRRGDVSDTDMVYLAWQGLAMGDHNAVDIAQEFHCNILKSYGLLKPMALPSS